MTSCNGFLLDELEFVVPPPPFESLLLSRPPSSLGFRKQEVLQAGLPYSDYQGSLGVIVYPPEVFIADERRSTRTTTKPSVMTSPKKRKFASEFAEQLRASIGDESSSSSSESEDDDEFRPAFDCWTADAEPTSGTEDVRYYRQDLMRVGDLFEGELRFTQDDKIPVP
jgi:hypothetical protein